MSRKHALVVMSLMALAITTSSAFGADLTSSLKNGAPELKSAGPLAFAPEGVLFVADPRGAALFALDTGDRTPATAGPMKVEGVDGKIAAMLGVKKEDVRVNDLAVNPMSGNAYLSISRGTGPDAMPVIMRVLRDGKTEELDLKQIKFAKTSLPKIAGSSQDAITKIAYIEGKVYVAGLSNEKFASIFRAVSFPFAEADPGTVVEIYHGSHGRFETNAPIRTFASYEINGEINLLAAYTCTPVVRIPLTQLKPGAQVKGTTIAELGNRNRPLDMIVYQKDGKNFILMANSSRGLMKISTQDIDKVEPITKRVPDKAGLTYETIAGVKGVEQLDRFDKENALVLRRTEDKTLNLESLPLP